MFCSSEMVTLISRNLDGDGIHLNYIIRPGHHPHCMPCIISELSLFEETVRAWRGGKVRPRGAELTMQGTCLFIACYRQVRPLNTYSAGGLEA